MGEGNKKNMHLLGGGNSDFLIFILKTWGNDPI